MKNTKIKAKSRMITPDTMRVAFAQRGERFFTDTSPALTASSGAKVCHNLFRRSEGVLERAGLPALAALAGGEPLIADRRGSGYFILRQEDDTSIIVDGYLGDDGVYTSLNTNLGACGRVVAQAEAAGEFVVLRYSDSTLGYILYHPDLRTYTLLGSLPPVPDINVTAGSVMEFTESVDGVDFRTPVADLRAGVDSDAAGRIGDALREAWKRLKGRALHSGYWLQPLSVCFVLRLWDGTVFHVSGPSRVECAAAGGDWQSGGRALLQPLFDSDGKATGTAPSSVSATGFRLSVAPVADALGAWSDVVRGLELWVSEECDPVDAGALPLVGVTASSPQGVRLTASLRHHAPGQLEAMLASAGYSCLKRWDTSGSPAGEIALDPSFLYGPLPEDSSLLSIPSLTAVCMLGHDGFLHLATKRGLLTCARGNPFTVCSSTAGDWSHTRLMTAQTWGGGAYTRQIIYVAGSGGVSALAHRPDGVHTNCRTICRRAPLHADHVAVSPDCVHMLLDNGSLVRLEGTCIYTVLTGIEGCAAIFADTRHDEVWLVPVSAGGHCVVMGGGSRDDVTTRSRIDAVTVPGTSDYVMHRRDNGLVELRRVASREPAGDSGADPMRWLGDVRPASGRGSLMRDVECGVYGNGIDLRLRVGLCNPSPGDTSAPQTLTDARISGTPRGRLIMRVRPGGTQPGILRPGGIWRAELKGVFDSFDYIDVAWS